MAFCSKKIMFLFIALLLFVSLVHAGRSVPVDHPKEGHFKVFFFSPFFLDLILVLMLCTVCVCLLIGYIYRVWKRR